ncbi:MAG: DUF4280 domain-containing protein [Chryseobacterium sp.]|nr:DUF4280 domain-containing protein [Candidatus Chryseobacterium enterohippi]
MPKKYVPEGAYLACNKGTSPCTLRVSNNQRTTIYNVPMASELDFIPFFNIKPMGFCTCPAKIASTGITCIPGVVTPWQNPKDGIKINGSRLILEDSHNNCIFGGEIKIFFDRPSAVAFGVGEGKMPSEYIKEGFDWLDEKVKDGRKERDKLLPDWMKPVTGVQDWFTDLGTGLVEGAVNGVVGLGETLYQVGQDPVGTTEALGGMIKDGATAAWEGANNAAEWASKGENWENAANGAWDWASDGENWKKAGESTVQGVKDSAEWVAENPRKIGNTVGEFIPDVAAAAATMGGSTAVTAGRVALKETAEAAVERAVKETVEEGVEKAGKEALEAGAKKAGKELIESLADGAGDIAKVVTKDAKELASETTKKIATEFDDALKKFDPKTATNKQKGNFGEMASHNDKINNPALKDKGYDLKRIGDDAPSGLDDTIKKGIDGIYENANPPPKYVIDEAKYDTSKLSQKPKDGPQMSDDWIKGSKRLENQVGEDKAREIAKALDKGEVDRVLSKIDKNGKVTTYKINADGTIGDPWP